MKQLQYDVPTYIENEVMCYCDDAAEITIIAMLHHNIIKMYLIISLVDNKMLCP